MEYLGIALGIIIAITVTIGGIAGLGTKGDPDRFIGSCLSLMLAGTIIWCIPVSGREFKGEDIELYFAFAPVGLVNDINKGIYVINKKNLEVQVMHDVRFLNAYFDTQIGMEQSLYYIIHHKYNIFNQEIFTNYELRYKGDKGADQG